MQRKPLISVIIPNYNHAPYLRQRIESVLNQTFQNFEVILLDDYSSDNSLDVLEDYKTCKNVNAILTNTVNSGSTFKQWQKGFEIAQGDYVWIAESDDYADPQFLESTISVMLQDPSASICFTGSNLVDSLGMTINDDWDKWPSDTPQKGSLTSDGISFIKNRLIWKNCIYNASAVLFKKSALTNIDITYNKMKYCGDWFFWIELARQGKVIEIYEKLNYFRQHPQKVSPRSEAIGLQFTEGWKVFDHIVSNIPLSSYKTNCLLGYMYRKIRDYNKLENSEIKRQLLQQFYNHYGDVTLPLYIYRTNKLLHRVFREINHE